MDRAAGVTTFPDVSQPTADDSGGVSATVAGRSRRQTGSRTESL